MQRGCDMSIPSPAPGTTSPAVSAEDDRPGTVTVSWTAGACVLELQGRIGRRMLDHARDLVHAQTRPLTGLTVRLQRTVVTRDVVAVLAAALFDRR